MTNTQKVYFKNLNGLRFIAAFLVVVHHIEQIKYLFGIDSYWKQVPFIDVVGKLGVVLFFVLSGFLITYLLLAEESVFKTIAIKKFYLRRVFRIWPLYFLILILAFWVLPNLSLFAWPDYTKDMLYESLGTKLLLYIAFLPNLVLALGWVVPYASHLWSIGTEEQYYLVWPVILKYFKKHRVFLMLFICAGHLLVSVFLNTRYATALPYRDVIRNFWQSFTINCMAIGGIFAILLFTKNKLLKVFLNNYVFYVTLALASICIAKGVHVTFVHYEFYSLMFGIIILNFAGNDNLKLSLENKLLIYLGNISYGLYMYHPIGIVLSLFVAKQCNFYSNWFLYPLCLLFTIVLAGVSYKYYESYFLRFKAKFANIISGNETKN